MIPEEIKENDKAFLYSARFIFQVTLNLIKSKV